MHGMLNGAQKSIIFSMLGYTGFTGMAEKESISLAPWTCDFGPRINYPGQDLGCRTQDRIIRKNRIKDRTVD